jgi:hypothetical protein
MDEEQTRRSLNTAHHRHNHREMNRSTDFCWNTMFLKYTQVHVYCKLSRHPLRQKMDVLTINCWNTMFLKYTGVHMYCKLSRQPLHQKMDVLTINRWNTMFLKYTGVHMYCKLSRQPLRQKMDVLTIKCTKHNRQLGQSALLQINESIVSFLSQEPSVPSDFHDDV